MNDLDWESFRLDAEHVGRDLRAALVPLAAQANHGDAVQSAFALLMMDIVSLVIERLEALERAVCARDVIAFAPALVAFKRVASVHTAAASLVQLMADEGSSDYTH